MTLVQGLSELIWPTMKWIEGRDFKFIYTSLRVQLQTIDLQYFFLCVFIQSLEKMLLPIPAHTTNAVSFFKPVPAAMMCCVVHSMPPKSGFKWDTSHGLTGSDLPLISCSTLLPFSKWNKNKKNYKVSKYWKKTIYIIKSEIEGTYMIKSRPLLILWS